MSHRGGMVGRRVRVSVLDDDEVARDALIREPSGQPTVEVIGDSPATFKALPGLADSSVDVVILDLHFPGVAGVELCRAIRERHPEIACLVLATSADEAFLLDAIIAGAAGYVLKNEPVAVIAATIPAIAEGHAVVDPSVTQRVLERMQTKDPFDLLSLQERRIFGRVAEGWSNKEIAEELSLAVQTVKNYVHSILSKLGLERRTQIIALVARKDVPE